MSSPRRRLLSPDEERDTPQQASRLPRVPHLRHASSVKSSGSISDSSNTSASSNLGPPTPGAFSPRNPFLNSSQRSSSSSQSPLVRSSLPPLPSLRWPSSPAINHAQSHPSFLARNRVRLNNPSDSPRSAMLQRPQHNRSSPFPPPPFLLHASASSASPWLDGDNSGDMLEGSGQASLAAGLAYASPPAIHRAVDSSSPPVNSHLLIDLFDDEVDAADTLLSLSSSSYNSYTSQANSMTRSIGLNRRRSLSDRNPSATPAAAMTNTSHASPSNASLLHGIDFSSSNARSSATNFRAQSPMSPRSHSNCQSNPNGTLYSSSRDQGSPRQASNSLGSQHRLLIGRSWMPMTSNNSATNSNSTTSSRNAVSLDLADLNQFPSLPGESSGSTTDTTYDGRVIWDDAVAFSTQSSSQGPVDNGGSQRRSRAMPGLHSVVPIDDPGTKSEADLRTQLKDLESKDACAVFLYRVQPSPTGSDVWPDIRDISKVPAGYQVLQLPRSRPVPGLSAVEDLLDAPTFSRISQLPPRSDEMPRVGTSGRGWPQRRLPTELYELICSYLARDDIKAMRLCCKEFDQHVSQTLFHTVVVPFNTEIYDMLKPRPKKRDVNGKGKSRAVDDDIDAASTYDAFQWKNEKDDEVYEGHGVDVFKGFGPHIRRYGMSFEVDESTLKFPPHKGSLEDHVSYWGAYQWPYQEYHRFEDVASLETTADETPKMKTAFSFLTKVRHLAVSLDCGLGWLKGPDVSLRSRILKRSPTVFGPTRAIPDRRTQAQEFLWAHLEEAHFRTTHDRFSVRHAELFRQDVIDPVAGTHGYSAVLQDDTSQQSLQFFDAGLASDASYDEGRHSKSNWGPPGSPRGMSGQFDLSRVATEPQESAWRSVPPFLLKEGILYTSSTRQESSGQHNFLVPNDLSKAQKEWLLEIEWAQRAFLSSYMLAVMDNSSVFAGVERLDFSRISSRFVSQLCRADFWDSLEGLETVSIQVVPDWHDVTKDNAGIVETQTIYPSRAVGPFVKLLADTISPRENIRNLKIGWADGGEHAEGMFARNQHILIAPLVEVNHDFTHDLTTPNPMLLLPHVEHLTLTNCWITPHHLQSLVRNHANSALMKLTLDSVSLTIVPRANPLVQLGPPPGQPMWANAVALQQLLTQNMQQLHHHFNNPAQPAHPGVPLGHGMIWNPHAAPGNGGPPAPPQLPQFVPPAYAPPPPAPAPQPAQPNQNDTSYLGPHREGSWPHVLDLISPGARLADFLPSSPSPSSPAPVPRSPSQLQTLELLSVGYVKLPHARFDQSALLPPATPIPGFTVQGLRSNYFLKRAGVLQGSMMAVKDELVGEVVQFIAPTELRCLNVVWGLREGWRDTKRAEEPEFDGFLEGGTGRVSGVIHAHDRSPGVGGDDGS